MSFKKIVLELKNDKRLKFIKWIWLCLLLTLITILSVFLLLLNSGIPSFNELENPQVKQASEILDANKNVFGVYYVENRIPVDFKNINPVLVDALIATEDERFYGHSGIDLFALSRVLVKTLILQKTDAGGGSTISQQLAKLLFERPNTKGKSAMEKKLSLIRSKFKEWIIAVKLERSYTKEELIAMYLNKFEFINGAHGIQAAAKIYFNKPQEKLSIGEAATLVGMLKNPSLYNPVRFQERAFTRRNIVLTLLENKRKINLDSIKSKAIDLSSFKKDEQSNGPAPYFRAELTKWVQQLIIDQKLKKSDGNYYNIYTDGLKIHTTIDLKYQAYAEEASIEHMASLQEKYFKVWKNMDPWTFEADSLQLIIRKEALLSKAKSSEAYLTLRAKILFPILSRLPSNLKTSDNIIETLIKSDENIVLLRELVEKGYVDQNELFDYK
jgi:penicillin-binding protein 1A